MQLSKALRRIVAALSLVRIVAINVVGLAVALVAAVHVYNRQTNPRPAPIARGILAAHATAAGSARPVASGVGASPWLPIEIELLGDAPAGSGRAATSPTSPSVNDANQR